MFRDLMTALKAGLREYRRLRWVRQHHRSIHLPF
jgi:hypothetical protein